MRATAPDDLRGRNLNKTQSTSTDLQQRITGGSLSPRSKTGSQFHLVEASKPIRQGQTKSAIDIKGIQS